MRRYDMAQAALEDRWHPDLDWPADTHAELSAADRHRLARHLRETLAHRDDRGFEQQSADDFARAAARHEKGGFFSRVRRALFGRRSEDAGHREAAGWTPPRRGINDNDSAARDFDSGRYANAVATAVRVANGLGETRPGYDERAAGRHEAERADAMTYPHPAYYAGFPPQLAMDDPAGHPHPQMMQPVAIWPAQPIVGWPMPPQAFGAMQASRPPYGWPSVPPAQQHTAPDEPWLEPPAEDEAEMEDLRESVRALRDILEALMQRRTERLGRAA